LAEAKPDFIALYDRAMHTITNQLFDRVLGQNFLHVVTPVTGSVLTDLYEYFKLVIERGDARALEWERKGISTSSFIVREYIIGKSGPYKLAMDLRVWGGNPTALIGTLWRNVWFFRVGWWKIMIIDVATKVLGARVKRLAYA